MILCILCLLLPVLQAAAAEDAGQAYTDTLVKSCMLAVRADVFQGFEGTVTVTLQDEYGNAESVSLTKENGYARNLQVAEGRYEVIEVSALRSDTRFEVKRMASAIHVKENEVAVARLVVTDYEIAEKETAITEDDKQILEKEENQVNHFENQSYVNKEKTKASHIWWFVWAGALLFTAGYCYLHYRKGKRSGR